MSDIKMIKEHEPKAGVFVLDGKYKIERFDELNWVVKVKDPAAKDKSSTLNGVKHIYKAGGYSWKGIAKGCYFGSVAEAVNFIAMKLEADAFVEGKRVVSLEDYIGKLEAIKEQILDELADFKPDLE